MRSPPNLVFKLNILNPSSKKEVDVCVASPHQFAIEHQQQFLPAWSTPLSYLILVLQQSSISLKESTIEVAAEKERLRAEFISFGCSLIFALQDRGYSSDLFDPRTGYPLLASQDMTWDDNAAVKALLNYPVVNYQQCSLITHPIWQDHVYPSTIATTAPQVLVASGLKQAIVTQNWQLK
ncbi:MAG: methylmalonic aciduria and homocystinuria type D protein [Pleurocapsa sp. SU_5_0]|nr:methylmalonic aciduria and homocystinuria type D protein [Pleurocapsa sp. SU_5_0]